MKINYKNKKVEKQCVNLKEAKKRLPQKVAIKLFKLINFIEAAENLYSIINYPKYNFHDLKGKKEGFYSIDIDGRRSPYRLIVSFDDKNKTNIFSKSKSIEVIEIEEVSKHYE